MAADATEDADDGPDDPAREGRDDRPREDVDPLDRLTDRVAYHPWQSLAVGALVLLVVLYAVLVQQELFLVIWLLLVGFTLYLVVRFVRAHERLADAAERLVRGNE